MTISVGGLSGNMYIDPTFHDLTDLFIRVMDLAIIERGQITKWDADVVDEVDGILCSAIGALDDLITELTDTREM